jgi:hypothetical protein
MAVVALRAYPQKNCVVSAVSALYGVSLSFSAFLKKNSNVSPNELKAGLCLVQETALQPIEFPDLYSFKGFQLQGRGLVRCGDIGVAYFHLRIYGLIYWTCKSLFLLASQTVRFGRIKRTKKDYALSVFLQDFWKTSHM